MSLCHEATRRVKQPRATADPHTAHKGRHTFTFIHHSSKGARSYTDILFTYRATSAATVCPSPHTLLLFFCFASVCLWSCGTGPSKPHVVLSPYLLISCDRCIPLGGLEFEHFIRVHESIKSHLAVRHRHMYTLYPYVESCQERSQHQ